MTYNDLNFPSFEVSLDLWQSGVLRKWKPEDDWEWWWYSIEDVLIFSNKSYLSGSEEWKIKTFYAIPCPSLGEMVERLGNKALSIHKIQGMESYCICTGLHNIIIANGIANTAPNAAAKGLIGTGE